MGLRSPASPRKCLAIVEASLMSTCGDLGVVGDVPEGGEVSESHERVPSNVVVTVAIVIRKYFLGLRLKLEIY